MIQDKKRSSEETKTIQGRLKELNLYEGKVDGVEGAETTEAENTLSKLEDSGMSLADIEVYGYRKKVGLPADLMLTGEYEMWEEYGDNFRQQMSDEEYQSLYKEDRKSPMDSMQEMKESFGSKIKEIDLMDKLFKYIKGQ